MNALDVKSVGRRIRMEREARQLSVDAIAQEAAVPVAVVEQLERGEFLDASLHVLDALAHALALPLIRLLADADLVPTDEEHAVALQRQAAAFFARLPVSLQTFVDEERAANRTIPEDALELLAGVDFTPPITTPEGWRLLMSAMTQGLYPS